MLLRILYHIGLLEYEGKFPVRHRVTPVFWRTLEHRHNERIRNAYLIDRLQRDLSAALAIPLSRKFR